MSFHEPKDPEENLPDWLKELRRRQREAEQGRVEEAAPEESPPEEAAADDSPPAGPEETPLPGEQPDWLMEIRRRHDKDAPPRPKPPADPGADDEPDISDTQPNVPIQPGEIPGLENDTFPEETAPIGWDAEPLVPDSDEEAGQSVLPPPPAWLADAGAGEQADAADTFEAEDEQPAEEVHEDDIEDWLTDDIAAEEAPTVEAEPKADSEPALPDWLAAEMDSAEDAVLQPEVTHQSALRDTGDLPDWLLQEETDEGRSHVQAFEGGDEESTIEPGELPSWLQALRPPDIEKIVRPSTSHALLPEQESIGPLAGLSGILPAEPDVVRIGAPRALSGRLQVSEGQQRHAATLYRLVAEEGRAAEDFSQQVAGPSRIMNWVIAGALLLASAIPLLSGSQSATRPQLEAYPEAEEVYDAIESLPANSPVLVAFDVEPALYGEVQAPAVQVLEHLLEQEARLVFISTQSTGPALAERLLAGNLSIEPAIATGNYVNLGYLSGGMAALRALASDPQAATSPLPGLANSPWNAAPLNDIESLDDFGLVLVISSQTEEARAWIEQTAGSLQNGLYMVASAQVAPLARPYLDSHPQTLRGLVSGLSGAAHYEIIRGEAQSSLGWDAFSYGLGAMVVAILLGGLYNRLIHIRPEVRDEEADA
jgi:hypothetical protein